MDFSWFSTAPSGLFWLAFTFFASLGITLFFTQKKRSLPLFFLLLLALAVLFGIASVPAFALAVGYRYWHAKSLLK